jgi:DNA modification methylase
LQNIDGASGIRKAARTVQRLGLACLAEQEGESMNEANIIYNTDCLLGLHYIPDESIDCCVTSPPYWGLRDYGHLLQIGQEQSPHDYVAKMIDVFREVKRVLKNDGTLWLNIGDSYASVNTGGHKSAKASVASNVDGVQEIKQTKAKPSLYGAKEKDLVGIPWMIAFALRADGWYLRQDIIWHKPNPMPESVTDRCTKSHEYIFLLSKSPKYYYDAESISEPVAKSTVDRMSQNIEAQNGSSRAQGKTNGNMKACAPKFGGNKYIGSGDERHRTKSGNYYQYADRRNKRDVWTVTTKPFKEAHFATFPEDLIEPCILAGCPVGGIVLDPFMGSGTTACVAIKNNRRYVGIELNQDYIEIANRRIAMVEAEVRLSNSQIAISEIEVTP